MAALEQLEKEVRSIKERNACVERDKAWETSWARRATLFLLTYAAIAIYFHAAGLPQPFVNAVVPALAFVISTLTLPFFKRIWLARRFK
ncbi:MAG: hypothetical protein AABW54_02985 [Candidatus Micrarchaeota archaeon]